ncbi:helix-turn-helix domain-containing protein (plasmid) [Paracoccus liaowanqingii]|uniref:Helix-turn-helix domain-containing protein n=2 Tax=Paracoccus liaowanqingii TaxID=2560053 RepID=A0A4Y5SS18_9RHOB|nr:helix-turn-helix domain-containing protein [Paracoccus liaowanqingii]
MGCRVLEQLPDRRLQGSWVQTERVAHEAWMILIAKSPMGAQIMHALTARLGDHNAVVISQVSLAKIIGRSERAVRTAISVLKADNWIEVRQLGNAATVNAYVINDRVAWTGKRDGIRYSLFSAAVVVSEEEQPDRESLGRQAALRRIPDLLQSEAQMPAGQGLPPISQPALPMMEPDLPATRRTYDLETGELLD